MRTTSISKFYTRQDTKSVSATVKLWLNSSLFEIWRLQNKKLSKQDNSSPVSIERYRTIVFVIIRQCERSILIRHPILISKVSQVFLPAASDLPKRWDVMFSPHSSLICYTENNLVVFSTADISSAKMMGYWCVPIIEDSSAYNI